MTRITILNFTGYSLNCLSSSGNGEWDPPAAAHSPPDPSVPVVPANLRWAPLTPAGEHPGERRRRKLPANHHPLGWQTRLLQELCTSYPGTKFLGKEGLAPLSGTLS